MKTFLPGVHKRRSGSEAAAKPAAINPKNARLFMVTTLLLVWLGCQEGELREVNKFWSYLHQEPNYGDGSCVVVHPTFKLGDSRF